LNISSTGAFFVADDPDVFPIDAPIELMIRWPFLLDGVRALNLVVVGSVVRSDAQHAAVRIVRYEFRTVALQPDTQKMGD
jgi:hypothetical protein